MLVTKPTEGDLYRVITKLGPIFCFVNDTRDNEMTQFLWFSKRNLTVVNYRKVIDCLYFSLKFSRSGMLDKVYLVASS